MNLDLSAETSYMGNKCWMRINTNKAKFVRWLKRNVEAARSTSFPTQRGGIRLGAVTESTYDGLRPSVTIDGMEHIHSDALTALPPASQLLAAVFFNDNKRYLPGLISFQIDPAGKRINVTATCNNASLAGYFETLVGNIQQHWPERRERVGADHRSAETRRAGGAAEKQEERTARPVGRPSNPDDEWAWSQVRLKGRRPKDVYPEWLKRIGERADTLADRRDSFKKAIRPNRLKGTPGEPGRKFEGKMGK